jgi:SNF2 family DNA or RNA helicase
MNTNLTESKFNAFINNKIGKNGFIDNDKQILYLENKDFFINEEPSKDNWLQIHSNKLVEKYKNSYLQYLLEQEEIADIPLKLFKITDNITSDKICHNQSFDNVSYLCATKIKTVTYKLYLNFKNGTEYMINLNEDNKYFLILDKPYLINWYRIRILPTGKYLFYISRNYLNFLLQTHDANGNMDDILVSIIKKHQVQGHPIFDTLKNDMITSYSFPDQNILDEKYNNAFKDKLFEHQIDNVNWIIHLERLSSINMTLINYVNTQGMIEIKFNKDHFYTNHSYSHIYDKDSLSKTPRNEVIKFRGGVLSDEAGMGKTRSMLGVILAEILYPESFTINIELLKSLLPKYIKLENKYELIEADDYNLNYYNQMIESNNFKMGQTLVIVPTHIVDIWQEEICEMTDIEIKYLVLSNITHVKKINIELLSSYNMVIMSNNLIVNKKYQEFITKKSEYDFRNYLWHRIVIDEASEVIRLETHNHYLDTKTSNIQSFIYDIDALNKWCITSTPLQYMESNLGGYIQFLGQNNNKDIIFNLDNNDIKKVIKNYFKRHDKTKLDDLPMPKVKRETVMLKQSGIEKAIYQSAICKYDKLRLMQLCTHIQISEEETKILGNFDGHKIMSLSEIEENMLKHYKNKIKELEKDTSQITSMNDNDVEIRNKLIETINTQYLDDNDQTITPTKMGEIIQTSTNVQYLYSLLDDYLNDYGYQKILSYLDDCNAEEIYTILHINQEIQIKHKEIINSRLTNNEREIKTLYNQMGLFKQNYITESVKEPCYICYEHFDKVIITECRHIFCGNCMKNIFGNLKVKPCPLCRRDINKDNLKVTDMKLIKKAEYLENLKDEDIKKYGTKIAFLIQRTRHLLEDKDNKIIIFSQWSSMLKLISNVLTEFSINHLTIKGNISIVKSAMTKFENNNTRVLLLNPDDCIFGNDLTIATHIIMTDVLMMNKNGAKTIENQLLGYIERISQNKEITITKLVTCSTIEEDYYKKQK